MATSGVDRTMSIWDVRNLTGPLQKYNLHSAVTNLTFSQKSFLALSLGNVVEVRGSTITVFEKFSKVAFLIKYCIYRFITTAVRLPRAILI